MIANTIQAVSDKLDTLTSDVDTLKKKEMERENRREERSDSAQSSDSSSPDPPRYWMDRSARGTRKSAEPRRPRKRTRDRTSSSSSPSRSPTPKSSTGPKRRKSPPKKSWADVDPDTKADYSARINFSDEEDGPDSSQLVEVSEQTRRLLTVSCTRSVPNETRKRTRSRFKLPKVDATRTPRVDHVMRALITQQAKSADKELARIQTFVLDSLAPISALLEGHQEMTPEEIKEASSSAAELIGNANARISRIRREKLVASINKNLTPLVKEDADFTDVSPDLFGPDFSKRAKDHLDQVKSLKAATLGRQQTGYRDGYRSYNFKKPQFFQRGQPSGRGSARGRGGAPNYKGSHGERQPR
jgi:flagellum-specific peptidoglycan hydrolase FlgJ